MDSEFVQVGSLAFEPYTMFRVRPITGRAVNVSEHGYRLGGQVDAWPPDLGAANLFVFGGSTTFGYGVADEKTIPAQLADQLAHLLSGKRVSAYNFATPNYVSIQERIRLEQLLLEGHIPRVAVFIDGFDEFIAPYYAPLMLKRFVEATAAQSRRQRISQAIRQLMGEFLRRSAVEGADESLCRLPEPGVVLDQYVSNVRLIRAVCHEFAVRPLFVWQPIPCYHYDGEGLHGAGHGSSSRLIDCVRSGYEMMNARRSEDFSGDEFLWLADIQQGRTTNFYVDPDHYTPEFSGEIASQIARHLVDRGWMG